MEIVSFEHFQWKKDSTCHYVHLTEVRIGLHRYEDFVRLLSQIGKQLQSLFPFSWKSSLLILVVNL